MAIYKLNSEKAKNRTSKARKITGFSLIGASSLVFLFMTGIVPALQRFFLGVFGVFGYVLCIALIIIGLAVLNRRKYVMPKRYAAYLIISVVLLLCVLQLIIVGNKVNTDGTKMGFWNYLGKNYSQTWTAGGILVGLLTTPILYIANLVGAYLIFLVGLAIVIALLVDTINHLRKEKAANEPVALQIKDAGEKPEVEPLKKKEEKKKEEETNVVLGGKLKEENPLPKPPTAKEMLGLDHKRNYAFEYHEGGQAQTLEATAKMSQNVVKETVNPGDWKKYILTPPQVDLDEYFKNSRARSEAPTKAEVDETIEEIKENETQEVAQEPQQNFEQTQIELPSEPELEPEEDFEDVDEK